MGTGAAVTVLEWISTVAGAALAVLVIVDVFLTIVHPDLEGPLAKVLQRETWRVAMAAGRRWRSHRRGLMALAGPVMTVLTFAVWIGLFVVACALVFWPFLDSFRGEPDLGELTFLDALYYSGTTVTVLGYGDVTPLRAPLKLLSFFASATGFGLFTGIVAYLIELISGVDERNRFALRVHDETMGEERGTYLAVRCLRNEDLEDVRERYESWSSVARSVQDRLHRYAFASLFYRSKEPIYDPEPALRVAAEAAIAGHLLASAERWKRLGPAVEHLDVAITRLLGTISEQYLSKEVTRAMESPSPTEADHRYVQSVREELQDGMGEVFEPAGGEQPALDLAFRARTALTGLDRITKWSEDGRFEPGWRE